jgi:hypothetical protein
MPGARRVYRGRVVPPQYLRHTYSYGDGRTPPRTMQDLLALPVEQRLEVTHADAAKLVAKINERAARGDPIPFSSEHMDMSDIPAHAGDPRQPLRLGHVHRAWCESTDGGAVYAEFSFDDEEGGARESELILEQGLFKELSLSHNAASMEPVELSLCRRGARAGTTIQKINADAYMERHAASPVSTPPIEARIQASADAVVSMASAPPPPIAAQPGLSIAPPPPGSSQSLPAAGTNAATAAAPAQSPPQQFPSASMMETEQPGTAPGDGKSLNVLNIFDKLSKKRFLSNEETEFLAKQMGTLFESQAKARKHQQQKNKVFANNVSKLIAAFMKDVNPSDAENKIASALDAGDVDTMTDVAVPALIAASEALMHRNAVPAPPPPPPATVQASYMSTPTPITAAAAQAPASNEPAFLVDLRQKWFQATQPTGTRTYMPSSEDNVYRGYSSIPQPAYQAPLMQASYGAMPEASSAAQMSNSQPSFTRGMDPEVAALFQKNYGMNIKLGQYFKSPSSYAPGGDDDGAGEPSSKRSRP